MRGLVFAAALLCTLPPVVAGAQDFSQCVPPCRDGFTCVNGACVSACNPPCAAGEQCLNGECYLPAPPTGPTGADPNVPPPAAGQPPPGTPPQPVPPPAAMQPPPATALPSASTPPSAAGPGSGGWVTLGPNPNAAPPPDGSDDARGLFHIVGYVTPSVFVLDAPTNDGVDLEEVEINDEYTVSSDDILLFGVGIALGFRYNFAHVVGFQSRFYFDLMPSVTGQTVLDEDTFCGRIPEDCDATGMAFRFGGDATLRLGPFAQAFPMYLGVGGFVGARQISVSSLEAEYNSFEAEVGLTSELGFIFGGRENMDLGVRFEVAPERLLVFSLSFGIAFASI